MKKNQIVIFLLIISIFAAITNEMGVIGVLPQITEKYQITTSQAGVLVSIFALVLTILGPFMTLGVGGFNRKNLLLFIMFVVIISSIVLAYSSSYKLAILFRIIPALFLATLYPLGISIATELSSPEKKKTASAKVFGGITIGLVLGVPITSLLAENFSLKIAFLFCAVVSLIAFLGIAFLMPSMPVKERISYGKQLSILKRTPVWLNILTVTLFFSTMYSVYTYFAEYITKISHIPGTWISILLMLFGLFGLVGNFLCSNFLQKNVLRTVITYPLIFLLVYGVIGLIGANPIAMIILILIWGTVHSAGFLLSQTWLGTETSDASEFGNSLYLSFANLGITVGSSVGGWFISQFGIGSLLLSGMLFGVLSVFSVILKVSLFKKRNFDSPTIKEECY